MKLSIILIKIKNKDVFGTGFHTLQAQDKRQKKTAVKTAVILFSSIYTS